MKRWWIVLLVAVHLVCGLHTAFSKTVTHDELWHLPVGILHWRTGRFDQEVLNPPLTRLWAGLPGGIAGVNPLPGEGAAHDFRRFVLGDPDYRTWYLWGRAFNLAFSVGTLLLIIRWAGEWYGDKGALIAGVLFATCPNTLAHSSLVTPDAGLMLAYTATLYVLVRWLDRRSWAWTIAFGLVLGLAQTTKFTAVLLYPIVFAVWAIWRRNSVPEGVSLRLPSQVRWQFPAALLISLLAWNVPFLFQGTGQPLQDFAFQSRSLQSLQKGVGRLASFPVPLPRDYLAGLDAQRAVMEQAHPSYLDGQWSIRGFRSYYLRTMQYKLPHGTQILMLLGLLAVIFRRGWPHWQRTVVLWLPTVLLLAIASASPMQLGVRYVMPVLPLMFLTAAASIRWIEGRSFRFQQFAFAAVMVGCGLGLRHHPHHLAYFNELTGGPAAGRYHLLDSNLDWGQDLHQVKTFMEEQGLDKIGLVYFGTMPAQAFDIDFEIPPGWRPSPGWHAVSVNYVMGRPHLLADPNGMPRASDLNEFAYFQRFEPVARLGYSIDIYHIAE